MGPVKSDWRHHAPSNSKRVRLPKTSFSASGWPAWLWAKRPIFRFVAVFGLVLGMYYVVTGAPLFQRNLFPSYLRVSARVFAAVLRSLGEEARAEGSAIASPHFAMEIKPGCDAIEPSVVLLAAILAFPASFRYKLAGILAGAIGLQIMNLMRIVSLYYAGVYFPSVFRAIHLDVWQPLFILLVILFWIVWVLWIARRDMMIREQVPG